MHIIYVDDERPALENFRFTVAKIEEIKSLKMFQDGEEALEYVIDCNDKKMDIPEAKENIRVIEIYLGDQQTSAVVRGKIAKSKRQVAAV